MPSVRPKEQRLKRYQMVVQSAKTLAEFDLEDLKQSVREEQPSFITRTVRALEKDGYLQRSVEDVRPTYRWNSTRNPEEIDSWLRQRIYGSQITCTPIADRPRERLLAGGAASLRNAELLAILIRTGTTSESALQIGEKIANHFAECLDQLPVAGRGELKAISRAVGDSAFCQIMAGIELGRRVAARKHDGCKPTKIACSQDAIQFCQRHFSRLASDAAKEEFHIICLDTKNKVMSTHCISVGTLDASLIHPREVFRPAIKDAAATVILMHNHPSGDPTPSREDLHVTRELDRASQVLGIKVLDHIVLGTRHGVSIRETLGEARGV